MKCQFVSSVERREAIVESDVRSSKCTIAKEARGTEECVGLEAASWVGGPVG